jgi:hypothetical protein
MTKSDDSSVSNLELLFQSHQELFRASKADVSAPQIPPSAATLAEVPQLWKVKKKLFQNKEEMQPSLLSRILTVTPFQPWYPKGARQGGAARHNPPLYRSSPSSTPAVAKPSTTLLNVLRLLRPSYISSRRFTGSRFPRTGTLNTTKPRQPVATLAAAS